MGAKIRWLRANTVYETSMRTVDRTFLFAPNQEDSHPLLDAASSPADLRPELDVLPTPSVINIIGAAVGRALKKAPIAIHSFDSNINHFHITFSVDETQLDNVVPFFQNALSIIARGINRLREREGHVFAGRARAHPCLDDDSAMQKLLYGTTNTVKDKLIENTAHSPFFTTYRHLARGAGLKYWYLDYDAYWAAGGTRKKSHRLKDYLTWTEWACTPLPHQQNMSIHQRQTWMRKQVKELEANFAEERKQKGQRVIGSKRLKETDPRERPASPKKSGREPLCHAASEETKKEYKREWKAFKEAFILASADYRNGVHDREFPLGSYKPPLLSIAKPNAP